MPYLIDASNLGGVLAGPRGARDAGVVVRFLMEWARGRGRVVVVFDGEERGQLATRYGALELVWSGGERSADDEIVRRLSTGGRGERRARGAGSRRDWIVVTDDRQLARRCRDAGARTERSASLAARLGGQDQSGAGAGRSPGAADPAGEKPAPSAEELEHWRRVFGARD